MKYFVSVSRNIWERDWCKCCELMSEGLQLMLNSFIIVRVLLFFPQGL